MLVPNLMPEAGEEIKPGVDDSKSAFSESDGTQSQRRV